MCGFAGELTRGDDADLAVVVSMAATMADRGPDGEGSWAQGRCALAHRRLSSLEGSKLWQVGLLKLWLQAHGL